ncbi:I78 family peptidase inhibitor [Octadecabacter sp.]|nr:I78 family peptidase inhibitor [Octadecabacter sp.]
MKNFILVLPFLMLAACDVPPTSPPPPANPIPPAGQDTCNAVQYADLVGQDATALERILIMGQVRVIRPGQPVTLDFRPNRINFNINAKNEVASIRCG